MKKKKLQQGRKNKIFGGGEQGRLRGAMGLTIRLIKVPEMYLRHLTGEEERG